MNSINLLPKKYSNTRKNKVIIYLIVIAFLVVNINLVHLIYKEGKKQELLSSKLVIINSEINNLNEVLILNNRLKEIQHESSALKSTYQNGKQFESKVLGVVERILPENMKIEVVNISNNGQVELINCVATSYEMVVDLLSNIKNALIIKELKISSITKDKTAESISVTESFPERDSDYIPIGDITTTDFFKDNYNFSLSFKVDAKNEHKGD